MGGSGGGAEYTVSVINKVNQQERSELASRTPRPEVLEGCGPRCNPPPSVSGSGGQPGAWLPLWGVLSFSLRSWQDSSQGAPTPPKDSWLTSFKIAELTFGLLTPGDFPNEQGEVKRLGGNRSVWTESTG